MKKFLAAAAVIAMTASTAVANEAARQGTVLDKDTGNADYTLWVRGTDGHDYFCRDEIVVKTGNNVRECISRKGGLFAAGLSGATPLLVVVGGITAAAIFNGGGSSTNSTN